jgi:hypothetical protein
MFWAIGIAGTLVAAVAVMALIGSRLPLGHEVRRTLKTDLPPDELWAIITDYAGQTAWRPELRRVEKLEDRGGHPVWREHLSRGWTITLETVEEDRPRRLARKMVDTSGFGGRWVYEIRPLDGGSEIIVTEQGEVYNPVFRFLCRFMNTAATVESYLKALGARVRDLQSTPTLVA